MKQFGQAIPFRWPSSNASPRRLNSIAIAFALLFTFIFTFHILASRTSTPSSSRNKDPIINVARPLNYAAGGAAREGEPRYTSSIVLGRLKARQEQVQWLDDLEDVTHKAVYLVDDPNSEELHLDHNHGRESRVYLDYIVNNYDRLDDITFFWHADKVVWHNNVLLRYDSALTINTMNRSYIMEQGYVPSRCDHWPGCPFWITFNPSNAEHELDPHRVNDMFNPEVFSRIFPNTTEFPPYFAETCCSQFAVTRDTIRSVPLEQYRKLLHWIVTFWADQYTGMAMEQIWQFLFLGKGRHCPSMQECYCKTYGLCLTDESELDLLENWNNYRSRSDELEWQQHYISDRFEERQKSLEKSGVGRKGNVDDDNEYRRIKAEKKHARNKVLSLGDHIARHWSLPKPLVNW